MPAQIVIGTVEEVAAPLWTSSTAQSSLSVPFRFAVKMYSNWSERETAARIYDISHEGPIINIKKHALGYGVNSRNRDDIQV